MTNPMIEKKVDEFMNGTWRMKLITWTAVAAKASLLAHIEIWARQALTDMYEMGRLCEADELSSLMDIDKQATIEILTQEGKKTGATDMKKRILEALPKLMDKNHSYYEVNKDFDLGLEKMTSEMRSLIESL